MSSIASAAPPHTAEPPSLLVVNDEHRQDRPLDPESGRDLLVNGLTGRLTERRQEYQLDDWFTTLVPAADVAYRHEVFRDLTSRELRAGLNAFSQGMRHVRRILGMVAKLHYAHEKQRWFLEVSRDYVQTVRDLGETLHAASLRASALQGLATWVEDYLASPEFGTLSSETSQLFERFGDIEYRVRIHGDWVEVRPVDPEEPPLAPQVLSTFARFRQEAPKSYLQQIRDPGSMDHVEAAIASFVARLYPDEFATLTRFCSRHNPLVSPTLKQVERELQFYLAYLDLVDATANSGVTWSLPHISPDQQLTVEDGLDIVLVLGGSDAAVPNSCDLSSDERLVVVTGPNQGGKTTFARMLGQLHLLAATGAPVPARRASIPLTDQIFTIFERGENLENLRGHLHDDLSRAHTLLQQLTPHSLVLLNEVYSSTSPDDALALAQDLLSRLEESRARTVCVTFLDELSHHSPTTVSMVAGVDTDAPTRRTYRIERRPADGLAYARALARQHGLTGDDLRRRLTR